MLSNVEILLKLLNDIFFNKNNESFEFERKIFQLNIKLLYFFPFHFSWMLVKNYHIWYLIFQEISLLSFFVNVLKSLFRIINHSFCNTSLKTTLILIQDCENYSFVIKMGKRFRNLWSTSINYSDLLPDISWHTNKIWELN